MKSQVKNKIIVALDVETADEAKVHIKNLSDSVGGFKIGLQLFTSEGPDFISEIVESGVKVFLDVKYHDIPVTVAKASVEAARLGVWMFNIHAIGGREMITRTTDSVREVCEKEGLREPKIIGVTVLTSSDELTLKQTGIESSVNQQVTNLAKLSESCGLNGVVASPNETKLIRQAVSSEEFIIVTPGVRLGDVENDDQQRVTTPAMAVKNGSDYLVIGRPILSSSNPAKSVDRILENIDQA